QVELKNCAKAELLYRYIDQSNFYQNNVAAKNRSLMNVTFTTNNYELNAKFVSESNAAGLRALKGHKVLGGMRASIYNAMTNTSIEPSITFMATFDKENQ